MRRSSRDQGLDPGVAGVERGDQGEPLAAGRLELLLGAQPDLLQRLQAVGHEGRGEDAEPPLPLPRQLLEPQVGVG